MNHTIGCCIIVCVTTIVVALSAVTPDLLSDDNSFLKNFVNHEFLNVIGVIMAITLASASQLHLTLNQIEERHKSKHAFLKTRANIRQGVYFLILAFIFGVILVTAKPLLPQSPSALSMINGTALVVLVWESLVLLALSQAVFSLEPDV